jgi:hypothetical protein
VASSGAGLGIDEALALREADLDRRRGGREAAMPQRQYAIGDDR